jgi:2OG-Fe(II) oxygenase superfamily
MKAAHSDTGDAAPPQLCEIKPQSFVYAMPRALTPKFCREMIRRFEASKDQQYQGRIGQQQREHTSIKRSTDLRISGRRDWQDIDRVLFDSLSNALSQISGLHPYFVANPFKDVGYNMQRTQPGEYYHWHVDAGPGEFSPRQLVAIWYLNDVEGPGGETEFLLQQLTVKPEQGKLILFPPFWTHVHRGVALQNGMKYIATTWVCFAADQSSSDG